MKPKNAHLARSEDSPEYIPNTVQEEDAIIAKALVILTARVNTQKMMDSPQTVRDFLVMREAVRKDQNREVFSVMYLDAQHRLITVQDEFLGTLTATSVYPRELVRSALNLNAAAVVLTHNHPSGNPTPSRADETLTQTLKSALSLVDVRVLDHIIVAGGSSMSMAEQGLV